MPSLSDILPVGDAFQSLSPSSPFQPGVSRQDFSSKGVPCCTTQVTKRKVAPGSPNMCCSFSMVLTLSRGKCMGSVAFVSDNMQKTVSATLYGRTKVKLPSARCCCQKKLSIYCLPATSDTSRSLPSNARYASIPESGVLECVAHPLEPLLLP